MSFQQVVPWFLVSAVGLIYAAFRISRKGWPPGHPWSAVALLLLAFQQFLSAHELEISSPF